ncbi:helix-turn-helix domain-containing protein [Kaarinaea lacus]
MKHTLVLFSYFLVTFAKLIQPAGAKALIAENLLLKHQLMVSNRSRKRGPNLSPVDRFIFGFCLLFVNIKRINKVAVIIQPATLLSFHKALVKRKYHLLFTPRNRNKPGPKGPSKELIQAIVEMKQRNPRFGCPRIAQQINKAFGTDIDKDVVCRLFENFYHPKSGGGGPSWLTLLGHIVKLHVRLIHF